MLTLYTYFRSSAAWRVRIALNLKGLPYDSVPVHLVQGGGQQHAPAYRAVNPTGLVPTMTVDGTTRLTQSLAIVEYLDETHPTPPLLPADPLGRARVRALAQDIACDIHPIDNLRVTRYLEQVLDVDADGRRAWYQHWVKLGFDAFESSLQSAATGRYCHGDLPTLADCCLVPQVFNAERFGVAIEPYPTIRRIVDECAKLDAFQRAEPAAQPDAPA